MPGHGEREILCLLRYGVNQPVGTFCQDHLSKGAVLPLFIPVSSPALDRLCRISRMPQKAVQRRSRFAQSLHVP